MTTISRRVDKLGRLVLPIDIRKQMGIETFTEVKMIFENGVLTITSHIKSCKLCGATLLADTPMSICKKCIQKVKDL